MTQNTGMFLLGTSYGERGSLGLFGAAGLTDSDFSEGFSLGALSSAAGSLDKIATTLFAMKAAKASETRQLSDQLSRLMVMVHAGNTMLAEKLDVMIGQLDEQTRMRRVENGLSDLDRFVPEHYAPDEAWYESLCAADLTAHAESTRSLLEALEAAYSFVGRYAEMAPAFRTFREMADRCEQRVEANEILLDGLTEQLGRLWIDAGKELVAMGVPAIAVPLLFDMAEIADAAALGSGAASRAELANDWAYLNTGPLSATEIVEGITGRECSPAITLDDLNRAAHVLSRRAEHGDSPIPGLERLQHYVTRHYGAFYRSALFSWDFAKTRADAYTCFLLALCRPEGLPGWFALGATKMAQLAKDKRDLLKKSEYARS